MAQNASWSIHTSQSSEFDTTGGFHSAAVSRHLSVGTCRLYFCEVNKEAPVNSFDWGLCSGAPCWTKSRTTVHNSKAWPTSSNGKLLITCADNCWLIVFPHYWPVTSASEEATALRHHIALLIVIIKVMLSFQNVLNCMLYCYMIAEGKVTHMWFLKFSTSWKLCVMCCAVGTWQNLWTANVTQSVVTERQSIQLRSACMLCVNRIQSADGTAQRQPARGVHTSWPPHWGDAGATINCTMGW